MMISNPRFSDKATLEKYSSAFTLSDMEIYVFPELMYPLVLANIMSPEIWKWRDDPWFRNMDKKSFNYKINRIKQYIMDHYVFNLDLETWGLTTKQKEMGRFESFMDMEQLRQSNALFGYEGDRYYFDINIRRHFGLDRYTDDEIPYWKTETVEAMNAFRYKDSFSTGAGECVSLATLYAAALFVVGRIPPENIFLMGTPLHSQNFIDIHEGILTNNRRIVTRTMWFNGTSMSAKARRALEHERVTLVSHLSGYIHHQYEKATIDPQVYSRFSARLHDFLSAEITPELFINFLRYHMNLKKSFQYRWMLNGKEHYVPLETVFEYEHNSRLVFSETTRESLMQEIDDEEFSHTPIPGRIILQDLENGLAQGRIADIPEFQGKELEAFLKVRPRLPDARKKYEHQVPLPVTTLQDRTEILALVNEKAAENEMALLALYAYRQMDRISWLPFIKAALERNPVSLEGLKGKSPEEAYQFLLSMANDSIYDGVRLAQPDETWNFRRGDGIEKAFLLANYLSNGAGQQGMDLKVNGTRVILEAGGKTYEFVSSKDLRQKVKLQ